MMILTILKTLFKPVINSKLYTNNIVEEQAQNTIDKLLVKTSVPVRSLKLSSNEHVQYLNGLPFSKSRNCKQTEA